LNIIHDPSVISPTLLSIKSKKIVTVYDLVPFIYPKLHPNQTLWSYRLFFKKILNKSDMIITISQNSKKDLMRLFKINENKIKVIQLAVSEEFRILDDEQKKSAKQNNPLGKFILFVGTLEPRKNIPGLLRAFYQLKKKGFEHKLVIVGKKGWKYEDIFRTIKKLNLKKEVIFLGYVPQEEIINLYNAADLFVFPSLYEGFGLPPLEAMACGCPVVVSNTSSMPEVCGNAALYVNPYNVPEIAQAMERVLTDTKLKKDMIKKGLKQAKKFSWEKNARETLEVYEELCDKK
jgi:glycosyltransferase involved in cell wall biosynthesis